MTRILYGKSVAAEIRNEVAAQVDEMIEAGHRRPELNVVMVGDHAASQFYVASKTRACEEAGIVGKTLNFPADISADALLDQLRELNESPHVDGILVQLPLPDHLPAQQVLEAILPEKDVDGFHPENVGRLWLGQPCLAPATPAGVLEMIKRAKIELTGRHAVIVGRSAIVGKPMAGLLLGQNCTVTVCHSRTRHLEEVCQQADLLVVAVGRAGFVGPQHVKEGTVVIDVGINRINSEAELLELYPEHPKRLARFRNRGYSVVGDVDFHHVKPKASAITPVPGGVGLLTVAQLLVNTLSASKRRQGLS